MDDQPLPPIQGPVIHLECPNMHFDDFSPCVFIEASRARYDNVNSLVEFCIS